MRTEANYEHFNFNTVINTVSNTNYPDSFPLHWHKFVEMIAIPEDAPEDAVGIIGLNQKTYELKPGDIMIIWPGELHEIKMNKRTAMIALQFPVTLLNEMNDFAKYMNLFKNSHYLSYQETPGLNETVLFSVHQIFCIDEEERKQFKNVEMTICLYELFISLGNSIYEKFGSADSIDHSNDKMRDKIQEVCKIIQEHSDENISLESVADQIGFSSCYLSRTFKKITTYSFVEYLMMQRVKRMQMLLVDNEMSITEAAYQAGFKSISTLNRVFRQYSGCSPSEYKKYYRANL